MVECQSREHYHNEVQYVANLSQVGVWTIDDESLRDDLEGRLSDEHRGDENVEVGQRGVLRFLQRIIERQQDTRQYDHDDDERFKHFVVHEFGDGLAELRLRRKEVQTGPEEVASLRLQQRSSLHLSLLHLQVKDSLLDLRE